MVLHKHVDPDDILQLCRHAPPGTGIHPHADSIQTPYSSRYSSAQNSIPKYILPQTGIPANSAYQLIHDELDFDGRPNLNVASFVTTYMEPECNQLIQENLSKNLADNDEYPAMLHLHQRCVSIIGNLWGAQGTGRKEQAIGTATTGSSEAIMLGGLAMKRRWVEKRQEQGKDTSKPNILMGANAQVALEKFARYFDVEARIIPVSKDSKYCLDITKIRDYLDENTIGIFVILGSTYTGHYESVEKVAELLDEYEKETGLDIPIHVDGASGALFCPFTTPSVKWDFRIPRVKSINSSGHKYGLVYPGVGWILWRDEQELPAYLKFELHYLGGTEETYTLNFSRPGAHVIAQYYNFIHLGFEGYSSIQKKSLANARFISKALEYTEYYLCLSEIHRVVPGKEKLDEDDPERYFPGLPVVSFRFTDQFQKDNPHLKQAAVSTLLRVKGWILPNYPLPPNEENTEILRVVVRESFSSSMCDELIEDIVSVTETLMAADQFEVDAFAHPDAVITLNDKITRLRLGKDNSLGEARREKARDYWAKVREHVAGKGIFKRGVC